MKPPPFYSLSEIAKAAGKEVDTVERWLRDGGVTVDTIPSQGRPMRIVYISELREHMPRLLKSMLIRDALAED